MNETEKRARVISAGWGAEVVRQLAALREAQALPPAGGKAGKVHKPAHRSAAAVSEQQ